MRLHHRAQLPNPVEARSFILGRDYADRRAAGVESRHDGHFETRLRRADRRRRGRHAVPAGRRAGARAAGGDGAGDRRSHEEEHRRRLGQRRRRHVQGGRSVDDRHRRGDDVDGDAGRAPEGRPGRSESHHHRGADVLLEGGPEHARAGAGSAPAAPVAGRRRHAAAGPGADAGSVARRRSAVREPARRRRCRRRPRCRSPWCRRASRRRPPRLRRHRRPIRSTRARTPSSRSTSWWCSA